MAEVLVLGAGVMGSAFCIPLCDSGCRVRLVGTYLDESIISELKATGRHPKLGITLPSQVVPFTHDELDSALTRDVELVVLGVSSAGVRWAAQRLAQDIDHPVRVLMLTKGLAISTNGGLAILPDQVRANLEEAGHDGVEVGAVGGPCIAGELAVRRHSGVVIGFQKPDALQLVRSLLDTPYYHHQGTTDLVGLEACAALKNFFAIAVGAAWENGEPSNNPSALLFNQALLEIGILVEYMGGRRESVHDLAGTGDLYVTCQAGRNTRMGRLLGRGLSYREAKAIHMPDDTVEGAELALSVGPIVEGLISDGTLQGPQLPLTRSLIESICRDAHLRIPWDEL
jgi:glycerol-3-phosphate dehydrogenase (NAD(P)+)